MRPISYTWKSNGRRDLGFSAKQFADVEPLPTFKNEKGEVEGVNYGQISTVVVNAIKEQQAQSNISNSGSRRNKNKSNSSSKLML